MMRLSCARSRFLNWLWLLLAAPGPLTAAEPLQLPCFYSFEELQQIVNKIFDETVEHRPWMCVEIPGFLVMSRGNLSALTGEAREIRRAALRLASVMPPSGWLSSSTRVVPVVLFAHAADATGSSSYKNVGGFGHVDPGVIALNTEVERFPRSKRGLPQREWRRPFWAVTTYHDLRIRTHLPPVPPWLGEGFFSVVRPLTPSPDGELLIHRMECRAPGAGPVGPGIRDRPPRVPWTVLEIPMREVLGQNAGSSASARRDLVRREHLMREAWLFVYWGLTGDDARRNAFWTFAAEATRQPATEAMFRRHFDMSYDELDVKLTQLLSDGGGAIPEAHIDAPPPANEFAEVAPRPANQSEIETLHVALLDSIERLRTRGR